MTYTPIPRGTEDWDVPVNAAFTDQDARITTNTNGLATVNSTVSTHTSQIAQNTSDISNLEQTGFAATDGGYQAWTYDSVLANGAGATSPLGTLSLSQIVVRKSINVGNIAVYLTTSGATLTAGQNLLGLYDITGTRLALTADQTTAWGSGAPKWIGAALTGSVVLTPGKYWVAMLTNGTTAPQFARAAGTLSTALYNNTLPTTQLRYATNGSGLTALPTSFTPSSNVGAITPFWVGLY